MPMQQLDPEFKPVKFIFERQEVDDIFDRENSSKLHQGPLKAVKEEPIARQTEVAVALIEKLSLDDNRNEALPEQHPPST